MANKRWQVLLASVMIGWCTNTMVGIKFQRNGGENEEQMVQKMKPES
jgi:hypothetical protein